MINKPLPDNPGYFINEKGQAYSNKTGALKPLIGWYTNKGYLTYRFSNNGVTHSKTAHRLVAENFIPNPKGLKTVNHINGDKKDNRVENLEWQSYTQNNHHAIKMGLNNGAMLTDADVKGIRDLSNKGMYQRDIASLYGCTQAHVSLIVRNRTRKELRP